MIIAITMGLILFSIALLVLGHTAGAIFFLFCALCVTLLWAQIENADIDMNDDGEWM